MSLAQLAYVSTAVTPMTDLLLRDLVAVSVRNNTHQNITGILLYGSGHFLQLLEGEAAELRRVFERIAKDPRHTSVDLLLETPAESRLFAKWNMGVINLDAATHLLDRERLLHVVRRAKIFRDVGTGSPGMEAMELLKYFRSQV